MKAIYVREEKSMKYKTQVQLEKATKLKFC